MTTYELIRARWRQLVGAFNIAHTANPDAAPIGLLVDSSLTTDGATLVAVGGCDEMRRELNGIMRVSALRRPPPNGTVWIVAVVRDRKGLPTWSAYAVSRLDLK